MRTFCSCLMFLLASLLPAASGFAALPLELNNTQWAFKGISFNASMPSYGNVFHGTVDSNGTAVAGPSAGQNFADNIGSLNGSMTNRDYTGASATVNSNPAQRYFNFYFGTYWNSTSGQTDPKGVAAPLTLTGWNAVSPSSKTYFVPVDGYGAIIGASEDSRYHPPNATISGSVNGTSMGILVSGKNPTSAELAGNWKVFVVESFLNDDAEYIMDLTLNDGGNESSGTGTINGYVLRWMGETEWHPATVNLDVAWTKSDDGVIDVRNSTVFDYIIRSGVMDKSKKAIYSAFYDEVDQAVFCAVAVKGDQFTSSSLLSGYNMVGIGGKRGANSTTVYGHMDVLEGGTVSSTDGNQTYVRYGELQSQDLTGSVLGFEQVGLASGLLAVTNMTFPEVGYFTGVRRTDGKMLVGIYHNTKTDQSALMFVIGQAAKAGPVVAPSTKEEVKNLTGMDIANATASGFAAGANIATVVSTASITDTFATNDTANFPQAAANALYQSMELGDSDVISNFPGVPSGYSRITPAWSPTVFKLPDNNSTAGNPAFVIVSWQIDTVGTGMQYKRVNQMALYKFRATDDGTANQTLAYTQRLADYPGMPVADIKNKGDGHYWITDAAYNKTALEGSDYFRPSNKYVIWTVLKDNGDFDSHRALGEIADPPAGSAASAASSSSSSGCMLNPMAGFGLEWLLLLLAPAPGIIRGRRG